MTIPPNLPSLRWVSTAIDPNDKIETFEELKDSGCEGVAGLDTGSVTVLFYRETAESIV